MLRNKSREPNFNNIELILQKKSAPRPVLFDFIIGSEKEKLLTEKEYKNDSEFDKVITTIKAFDSGGYDFAPIIIRGMEFNRRTHYNHLETKSLNEGVISNRKAFNDYVWPNVKNANFSMIKKAGKYLHRDAKFIAFSHDGILENTIGITGFDNLCYLLYDDPQLVEDIFNEVGKRIEQYFTKCLEYDHIGAIICNDDWGFNTQTMLPPKILRKYVFPWYKKIVEKAHHVGKYAILHSCGYYNDIMEDIIHYMEFDGRHSYEDKIVPVEKAYSDLYPNIAVLGGMDVDFLTRSSSQEVYKRCKEMINRSRENGGYALGSGNSVPDYIPNENFLAMLKAAIEE